ncbi:MAG: hypothetical protein M1128_00885 [Candidatus Marsarchaeota archaeon]|nr:hypothetical protein [Candidatus Marsarchaeota archaeon]
MIRWNAKKLRKQLKEDKKRNFEDNLKFIELHVAWLKRTSNREWSKRQKILINEIYKRNRKLKV